jgi:hypothetical protein
MISALPLERSDNGGGVCYVLRIGPCEPGDERGERGRFRWKIDSCVLAVELDGVGASLLLEPVPSMEGDRGLVRREDHQDVGLSGREARVVLAKQRAPDPRALSAGIDMDAVALMLRPDAVVMRVADERCGTLRDKEMGSVLRAQRSMHARRLAAE